MSVCVVPGTVYTSNIPPETETSFPLFNNNNLNYFLFYIIIDLHFAFPGFIIAHYQITYLIIILIQDI